MLRKKIMAATLAGCMTLTACASYDEYGEVEATGADNFALIGLILFGTAALLTLASGDDLVEY